MNFTVREGNFLTKSVIKSLNFNDVIFIIRNLDYTKNGPLIQSIKKLIFNDIAPLLIIIVSAYLGLRILMSQVSNWWNGGKKKR